jgi:1-acyl-sn-glycerol-3-phosphate acyltransferase
VFIDRRNPESRAAGRRGVVAFIEAGFKIQLFPEGTRTRSGAIAERVHLSLVSDCYDAGLPVIPCAVARTEDALPTARFGAFPLQRAILYISPVMHPSEFADRDAFAQACWQQVVQQANRLNGQPA